MGYGGTGGGKGGGGKGGGGGGGGFGNGNGIGVDAAGYGIGAAGDPRVAAEVAAQAAAITANLDRVKLIELAVGALDGGML